MRKGKQPQKKVRLPEGWWPRFNSLYRSRWMKHEPLASRPKVHLDIFAATEVSRRSFSSARKSNEMTESLFGRLADKIGLDPDFLLENLRPKGSRLRMSKPPPSEFILATQKSNPQGADYRDFSVGLARPWVLRCDISTESPYFRFGFKLLTEDGRLFGDALIISFDENLVVHIGRNNWHRHHLGIAADDIFIVAYMNGIAIEDDRFLFKSTGRLVLPVELMIDRAYCAILSIAGKECFRRIVPPALCHRVAMYAWGDREEFLVEVTDIALEAKDA
ncbi:hypothetical protein [Mesorhizobium shangrilense]|uniref:XRE family transcriptional regulator n=1 Tax=Mesorhizobium shangrilense TaxID=460060 RepID=A0ABV2DJ24_9HYPH